MSMMAVFSCRVCKTEHIAGYFKGNDYHEADYVCVKCLKRTRHAFVDYRYVDERTEDQRVRERLNHK